MMTTIKPKTGSLSVRFSIVFSTCLTIIALCFSAALLASTIAVLDFELNDVTGVDDNSEEVKRTASLAPMLRSTLANQFNLQSVAIPPALYQNAQQGFGYLFEHPDEAAKLGQEVNADWVVITRLHKPSFLFSYLIAQVVNVKQKIAYPEVIVEIKGQQEKMNQRGISALAKKLNYQIKTLPLPSE